MSDSIDVEYGKLEELFSQKVTSPPAAVLSPEAEDSGTRARRNSHRETEVREHQSRIFEPRCEKTGIRDIRPGPTQTASHLLNKARD